MTNTRKFQHFMKSATPYLLVAPVIIYYAVFWFRPVITLVVGSFTALDGGGVHTRKFRDGL